MSIFAPKTRINPNAWLFPNLEDYFLTENQEKALNKLTVRDDNMITLSDLSFYILGEQSQYVSYYFNSVNDSPVLTENLRTDSSSYNYHQYFIHINDVREFLARLHAFRRLTQPWRNAA
jgi:hypothetical protein